MPAGGRHLWQHGVAARASGAARASCGALLRSRPIPHNPPSSAVYCVPSVCQHPLSTSQPQLVPRMEWRFSLKAAVAELLATCLFV